MGLDGFTKFIEQHFPDVYQDVHISAFSYKKIMFDVSSYIYKYMSMYGKENNKWLNAFVNLILFFKQYNVHAIFVFDGTSPPEKEEEKHDRGNQRNKTDEKNFNIQLALSKYKQTGEKSQILIDIMNQLLIKKYKEERMTKIKRLLRPCLDTNTNSDEIEIDVNLIEHYLDNRVKNLFNITKDDIQLLKTLLEKFKIPYLQAPDEAESLCNYLVIEKIADATFSLDSDCIAYGVPLIINKIELTNCMCRIIDYKRLCQEVELTPEQVTLLCILVGNDYNRHTKNIKGLGPSTSYKLIKQYESIQNIRNQDKRFQIQDDGLRYERCLELFSKKYPEFKTINFWDSNINIEEIENFCLQNNIYVDKNKINKLWNKSTLIFID